MKETGCSVFYIECSEENIGRCEKEIEHCFSFSRGSMKEKRGSVFFTEQSEEKIEVSSLKEERREENIRRSLC
jgi:transcriptional/translational regulatory protein YebC/TACO1